MSVAAALAPVVAAIPSPSQGVWHLGPLPLRAYALFILAGIVLATLITQRRWEARGGHRDQILDIVFWAVPFGIVGGRIYHLITSPDAYFGEGGEPLRAFAIWEGGLGIWGAVALGAVGALIGCRRQGLRLAPFADALAPGLLVAQAVGRLGNWFNQELFGGPTDLPWGLRIDDAHLPAGYASGTLFHPTFLYELVWNLAAAALIVWLDRRRSWGHGRVFWLYVVLYTAGRLWIEALRIDEAHEIAGLRVNVWVSLVVCVGALVAFVLVGRRHPGRDTTVRLDGRPLDATDTDTDAAPDADAAAGPGVDPAADPDGRAGATALSASDAGTEGPDGTAAGRPRA
ncbi:prolipoprotein diacylglyceryl transferase [Cellulomonas endophytica]|uniref:prolipoprotein diacylglyceryl transferase n=1 Tax=Cellulomonas endophytica TaxID=2494735 RepID=UPI001010C17B|nr:prolipoprotein diacylglyceryl transferase [Cellulomonas endophytica]